MWMMVLLQERISTRLFFPQLNFTANDTNINLCFPNLFIYTRRENYLFECDCDKCKEQCDDPNMTSSEEEDEEEEEEEEETMTWE